MESKSPYPRNSRSARKGTRVPNTSLKPALRTAIDREVNRLLRREEELKYNMLNSGNLTTLTNAAPYVATICSNIVQGVTDSQRTGDRIHLKSLDWRVRMTLATPSTNQGQVRLLVVQTKASSQLLTFALVQLFFNEPSGQPGPLSAQSVDYRREHVILADKTFDLDFSQGVDRFCHISVKKFPIPLVQYNAGSTTCEGEIRLIALTNCGAVANNATISGQSLVRFTDA